MKIKVIDKGRYDNLYTLEEIYLMMTSQPPVSSLWQEYLIKDGKKIQILNQPTFNNSIKDGITIYLNRHDYVEEYKNGKTTIKPKYKENEYIKYKN